MIPPIWIKIKPEEKKMEEDDVPVITPEEFLKTKQEYKNEIKKSVKKKFKVGQVYALKTSGSVDGSDIIIKYFICKKFIYTINNVEIASVVMKQIEGVNRSIFTLNKKDCKRLHIKYEPGLQVFSMYLPFRTVNYSINNNQQQIENDEQLHIGAPA